MIKLIHDALNVISIVLGVIVFGMSYAYKDSCIIESINKYE